MGFSKTGQIKVTQDPNGELKKIASDDEKEFVVDDLKEVKDSDKKEKEEGK